MVRIPQCGNSCAKVAEPAEAAAFSNGNWTYTTLYDFTGGSDGANPEGGLVMDASGNLYGTTFGGGAAGGNCSASGYTCGVVFEITR
jgi:hypothetical protein